MGAWLLSCSPAFGQVTVSSANDNYRPTNTATGRTQSAAPSYNNSAASAVVRNYQAALERNGASSEEVQRAFEQLNQTLQQEANSGGGSNERATYRNSDSTVPSSPPDYPSAPDQQPSGTAAARFGTSTPAAENAVHELTLAERSIHAQEAMGVTRQERQRLQEQLIADVAMTLDAPAGPGSQDTAFSQGGQPGNFPDVADQYTAGRNDGGTAPGVNYLDHARQGGEAAAMEDGGADDPEDAALLNTPRFQWLRDLRHDVAEARAAFLAPRGEGDGPENSLLGRYLNSDLPYPLPPTHEADFPVNEFDIIAMHPIWQWPIVQNFMPILIDSAQRHSYHRNHANGE